MRAVLPKEREPTSGHTRAVHRAINRDNRNRVFPRWVIKETRDTRGKKSGSKKNHEQNLRPPGFEPGTGTGSPEGGDAHVKMRRPLRIHGARKKKNHAREGTRSSSCREEPALAFFDWFLAQGTVKNLPNFDGAVRHGDAGSDEGSVWFCEVGKIQVEICGTQNPEQKSRPYTRTYTHDIRNATQGMLWLFFFLFGGHYFLNKIFLKPSPLVYFSGQSGPESVAPREQNLSRWHGISRNDPPLWNRRVIFR